MKKIILLVPVFLVGLAVYGQSRNSFDYREDKTLSDTNGFMLKKSALCFPGELFDEAFLRSYIDSNNIKLQALDEDYNIPDSILNIYYDLASDMEISSNIKHLEQTSSFLKRTNEPVFYNYQFKKETYRFTWITSFDDDIIFTLILDQDSSTLIIKRQSSPLLMEFSEESFSIDSLKTIEFKEIIDSNDFDHTNIIELNAGGLDGAIYILEANLVDGYHIFYRWNPEQSSAARNIYNFFLEFIDDDWKNDY